MTKCSDFEELNKTEIIHKINPNKNQSVFFSKVVYGDVYNLNTFKIID